MEIKNDLSFIKRFVGLILFFVLLIHIIAYIFSLDQPTWNNFFDKLFLISFFSTILNIIFYSPGSVQHRRFLGYNFTPVKLEGSRVILGSMIIASIVTFLLSIAIPVFSSIMSVPRN